VEVKIGVLHTARELVLDSAQTPEQVLTAVTEAIAAGGVLSLLDDKGRRVIVPVAQLAYIEIGEGSNRRVGFGTL
jgi:hypothetical protein